jgi:hypothetical protein
MEHDHRPSRPARAAVKRILLVLAVAAIAAIGWFTFRAWYTLDHLPEAYAAWDAGTLLVEYMKAHENRWPGSWDELLAVFDGEAGSTIPLRGSHTGDVEYARTLQRVVKVDWTFDPARPRGVSPVTRLDGTAFPIVWECGEPNEMVRARLEAGSKNPPAPR